MVSTLTFGKACSTYSNLRKVAEEAMTASHCQLQEEPWFAESALTKKLFVDKSINGKPRFFKFDLWHCFHLGVGKHWCGAALVLLSKIVPGSNADLRFDYISSAYLRFCKEKRIPSIITKIDQHTCNATGCEGTWNKAATTSNMRMFLEHFCSTHANLVTGNRQLEYIEPLFELYTIVFHVFHFLGVYSITF